jgi:hypothetical protein
MKNNKNMHLTKLINASQLGNDDEPITSRSTHKLNYHNKQVSKGIDRFTPYLI